MATLRAATRLAQPCRLPQSSMMSVSSSGAHLPSISFPHSSSASSAIHSFRRTRLMTTCARSLSSTSKAFPRTTAAKVATVALATGTLVALSPPLRLDVAFSEDAGDGLGGYFGIGRRTHSRNEKKQKPAYEDELNPEIVRQMAGGSLAGFAAGLVISLFSRSLVVVGGMVMMLVQFAARYGIDLIQHFELRQRLKSSRIIQSLRHHPTFKLSFGLTFLLAAFAQF